MLSIAEMQPNSDHESLRRTIKVLYYLYAPLILNFYVLAATISVCTLQTISSRFRDQKAPRRSILWLKISVAATYVCPVFQCSRIGVASFCSQLHRVMNEFR